MVGRGGTQSKLRARRARDTWSAGPSTSPLDGPIGNIVSPRAQGLMWAAIGFVVPGFWGVLGFIFFNAPQSSWTDLFWALVYITCPPWLLPETSLAPGWVVAPILNACLYGLIAMVIVHIRRTTQTRNASHGTDGPSNNRWRGP